MEEHIRKREETFTATLQQRDEEWREELANRDIIIRAEFREREKAFVSGQLKMD